jgi:4-hydroxy-3-methylbut-2-enyl diphosphate reductase
MELLLARPRGFCAGVDRAVDIVEMALEVFGPPVYVRHEIVHNSFVVDGLRRKGAVFADELTGIPAGAPIVFSAHGVSPAVRAEAAARGLRVIDATCPLVTKVHLEALRYAKQGFSILLIGHMGHIEVEGTMGEAPQVTQLVDSAEAARQVQVADPGKVAYLTQTTLSVDEAEEIIGILRGRFPDIQSPPKSDICYATTNRQAAVKDIASRCDLILVVGSPSSSNSNRLVEVAKICGAQAYLVERGADIRPEWLEGVKRIGVTSGASAPEVLVEDVLATLRSRGALEATEVEVVPEDVAFTLPRELAEAARERGVSADHLEKHRKSRGSTSRADLRVG